MRGMHLHQRSQHPSSYHEMLEAKDVAKRKAYTSDEINLIAMAECRLREKPRLINVYLAGLGLVERSADQIRAIRKSERYQATLASMRNENRDNSQEHEAVEDPQADWSEVFDAHLDELSASGNSKRSICAINRLIRLRNEIGNVVEVLDDLLRRLYPKIFALRCNPMKKRKEARKDRDDVRRKPSEIKREEYALQQKLWRRNRSKLAKILLDDAPLNPEGPPIEEVERVYLERFGDESPPDEERIEKAKVNRQMGSVLLPITEQECSMVLRQLQNSAPGPDKLKVQHLKLIGSKVLCRIFSIWMRAGKVPMRLKESRTTLIPKSNKDLEDIGKWRPITIGSHLVRLYTKILARRLQGAVTLNYRQKAFRPVEGCAENVILLNSIIKDASTARRRTNLAVAILDLAKAFDTVSHHSVIRALKRQNVPQLLISIVEDLYQDCWTVISLGTDSTSKIRVNRGVKQGCPLSPLLFNLVIDELLDELPDRLGYNIKGVNVKALAFADDLVLIGNSPEGLQSMMETTSEFLKKRGLRLQKKKCTTLGITHTRGRTSATRIRTSPFVTIGEDPVPVIRPGEWTKYLGVQIGPQGTCKLQRNAVRENLERLRKARLKPQQKVFMLRFHFIPRWSYSLAITSQTVNTLNFIDREVRRCVRSIVHAPASLSNDFIHLPTKCGGLGIPCCAETYFFSKLRLKDRLLRSEDPAIAVLAPTLHNKTMECLEKRFRAEAEGGNLKRASTTSARRLRFSEKVQGYGSLHFSDKYCNNWLVGATATLTGRNFVQGCALRSQTLPTRESITRGRPGEGAVCRNCGLQNETQAHILQNCHVTNKARLARHNAVLQVLVARLRKENWRVQEEPIIPTASGSFMKPDVHAVSPSGQHFIWDAAVPYEGNSMSLEVARRAKVQKYASRKSEIAKYLNVPAQSISFDGIVVGARGAVPDATAALCTAIGLGRSELELMSLRALEGSLRIFRLFMAL